MKQVTPAPVPLSTQETIMMIRAEVMDRTARGGDWTVNAAVKPTGNPTFLLPLPTRL